MLVPIPKATNFCLLQVVQEARWLPQEVVVRSKAIQEQKVFSMSMSTKEALSREIKEQQEVMARSKDIQEQNTFSRVLQDQEEVVARSQQLHEEQESFSTELEPLDRERWTSTDKRHSSGSLAPLCSQVIEAN